MGTLNSMGEGPPKPTPARFALAENLKLLMGNYWNPYAERTGISSRELAKALGGDISYKTIDRMLDPYEEVVPKLDSMDAVAHFFRVETFRLLLVRKKETLLRGAETVATETHSARQAIPAIKKRQRG